ncbi:YncE family protein [Rhodococcus marinonascens]|uniref:YncE family protein n=1 Tax=Rhodococcus marinonascens TaxID=38311 RepID=UPI001FEBBEB7|nr:hypothetical protein [Rhodococcus marinonascens]
MNPHSSFRRYPTIRGRTRRLVLGMAAIVAMVLGMAGTGAVAAADTVIDTILVGNNPFGVAITLDGSFVYVVNTDDGTVSVIDTGTNMVVDTVMVGSFPEGVAITPDGTRAYVVNTDDGTVSVIDTGTNTVADTVPAGNGPVGAAITPDGSRVYVTNLVDGTVSVIAIEKCLGSLCIDFGSLTGSGSGSGSVFS